MHHHTLLLCSLLCFFFFFFPSIIHAATLMKHSFKPPLYLVKGNSIPFWKFGGNAVVNEEYIRLTTESKSQRGWLFNTVPVWYSQWQVLFEFKIHSSTSRSRGADGLAFWYIKTPDQEGPVYGGADRWEGLGIFFDTFDNNGRGAQGSIHAVLNDGTKHFDHATDGESMSSGNCVQQLRNPSKNSLARVTYDGSVLTLEFDPNSSGTWRNCFSIAASLPTGYYFGLSAATGDLFDNHDVFSFQTTDPSGGAAYIAPTGLQIPQRGGFNPVGTKLSPQLDQPMQSNSPDRLPQQTQQQIPQQVPQQVPQVQQQQQHQQHQQQQQQTTPQILEEVQQQQIPQQALQQQIPQQNLQQVPQQQIPQQVPQPPSGTLLPVYTASLNTDDTKRQNEQIFSQLASVVTQLNSLSMMIGELRREVSEQRNALSLVQSGITAAASSGPRTPIEPVIERQAGVIIDKIHAAINTQNAQLTVGIQDMTTTLRDKIPVIEQINRNVGELLSSLRMVRSSVEQLNQESKTSLSQQKTMNSELREAIAESGSVSFWIYIIMFQFVFFGVFVYWRKSRDEKKWL